MVVYDIPTNTITINVDTKFTFSRLIPGTDKLFVTTHNYKLQLYDISYPLPIKDSSFSDIVDSIREVVVNPVATIPRFYVLTANTIKTYSLSTWTLISTKTKAQLAVDIGGGAAVISIDDISGMKANIGVLAVLTWTVTGSTYDTCILLLDEQTLAKQRSIMISSNSQFSLITTSDAFVANTDLIFIFKPNSGFCFSYKAGDPSLVAKTSINM